MSILSVFYCIDLLGRFVLMCLLPLRGTKGLVVVALVEGIIIIFLWISNLPFKRIKIPKAPFARVVMSLLFLTFISTGIGLSFGWPIRYLASDIWKFMYIFLLYFLLVPYTRDSKNSERFLQLSLGWGIGTMLIDSMRKIQEGTGYFPIGSGMPYLGVIGLMLFLKRKRRFSYLLIFLGLLISILSGQRTGFVMNIIVFLILISLLFITKGRMYRKIMLITEMALMFFVIMSFSSKLIIFHSPGFKRQIQTFQTYKQQPRKDEVLDVVNSFKSADFTYKHIVGLGAGALWTPLYTPLGERWERYDNKIHNIHITFLAMFYRHGFLGILILVYVYYLAFKALAISYKKLIKENITGNQIGFLSAVLFLCAAIYGLTAFHFFNPYTQLPLPIYMAMIDRFTFSNTAFLVVKRR